MHDVDESDNKLTANPSIFQINANEFWLAYSIEDAVRESARLFNTEPYEILDDLYLAHALTEEELWSNKINIDNSVVPFKIAMARLQLECVSLPHFFASKE